jgi:predicted nucleic acid-binding protein
VVQIYFGDPAGRWSTFTSALTTRTSCRNCAARSAPLCGAARPADVPDPRPARDAFIAATALVHGLTVVTRKVRDFAPMGVEMLDPWTDER